MKIELFIALAALFALTSGVFVPPRPGHKKHLLGAKECTWGPSYWCKNLTAAADCHATKHCIQTVWIHKQLPPDTDSVCQICKDMVGQARDQLESNETQEEIKEVFEGSCALLRIKPIVKECDKIADDYIPDMIDTLASQMNPQIVCSVAGLCNSEWVDQLIEESKGVVKPTQKVIKGDTRCQNCHAVVDIIEENFRSMSKDEVLQKFLQVCGEMSSFSDACSNIIVTYFTNIYNYIQDNFNVNDVCLLSGECSAQFHTHNVNVEITPISKIGYVPVDEPKDNLPCNLCEQLVNHLRDLLITNTTREEFKMVMEGLCKQTGSFAQECNDLVQQYYEKIYEYLVNDLNSTYTCQMIGICNNSTTKAHTFISPLLPVESVDKTLEIMAATNKPIVHVNIPKDGASVQVLTPEQQQLPIDLLMPPHTQNIYNQQACVLCEYLLHVLQEQITSPATEEEIKRIVDHACTKLPSAINASCIDFVNTYEPAVVAILAQEIDPSQVCPLLKICPSSDNKDVEIFMQHTVKDSKCPLCLYAVTKLEEMVKNKKDKDDIKNALDHLCLRLPKSLSAECEDFVQTYTNELVEMLINDFKPQEVCVYLKCCTDDRPPSPLPQPEDFYVGGNIETNVIPDDTINGEDVEGQSLMKDPQCVLCEFVMKQIDDELKDKKTDEDIKNAVRTVCSKMPKSINKQCDDFLDQYADTIIALLTEALEPSEICTMMKLCKPEIDVIKVEVVDCIVCEATVDVMKKILANPKVDHDMEHVLEKACRGLPQRYRNKCRETIDDYGPLMIDLLRHNTNAGLVCNKIGMCKSEVFRPMIIDYEF